MNILQQMKELAQKYPIKILLPKAPPPISRPIPTEVAAEINEMFREKLKQKLIDEHRTIKFNEAMQEARKRKQLKCSTK